MLSSAPRRYDMKHKLRSSTIIHFLDWTGVRNQDSTFHIATGHILVDRGVSVRVAVVSRASRPLIHCTSGAVFPGIIRWERETDHSPATDADVFMTYCLSSVAQAQVHLCCMDIRSRLLAAGSPRLLLRRRLGMLQSQSGRINRDDIRCLRN
jgi:hypothetical protein